MRLLLILLPLIPIIAAAQTNGDTVAVLRIWGSEQRVVMKNFFYHMALLGMALSVVSILLNIACNNWQSAFTNLALYGLNNLFFLYWNGQINKHSPSGQQR